MSFQVWAYLGTERPDVEEEAEERAEEEAEEEAEEDAEGGGGRPMKRSVHDHGWYVRHCELAGLFGAGVGLCTRRRFRTPGVSDVRRFGLLLAVLAGPLSAARARRTSLP